MPIMHFFQKVILTDRNHLMVDRATPLLEKVAFSWPSVHCIFPARKGWWSFCVKKATG